MKYGESGSSDEDGSGSGFDNKTEDEEEEDECQVLLNQVRSGHDRRRSRCREVPRLLRRWKEYRLPRVRTDSNPSVRRWERCRQSIE
jgi:hypothetical protein